MEQLIDATPNLRYRVFLPATCSVGLRLSETLALQGGSPATGGRQEKINVAANSLATVLGELLRKVPDHAHC